MIEADLIELAHLGGDMYAAAADSTLYAPIAKAWSDYAAKLKAVTVATDLADLAEHTDLHRAFRGYMGFTSVDAAALGQVGIGISSYLGLRALARELERTRPVDVVAHRYLNCLGQHASEAWVYSTFLRVLQIDIYAEDFPSWMERHQDEALHLLNRAGVRRTSPSVIAVVAKATHDNDQLYAWKLRVDALI